MYRGVTRFAYVDILMLSLLRSIFTCRWFFFVFSYLLYV